MTRPKQPARHPQFGLKPILDLARLTWWKWARRDLTIKNPMHPDLPMVVRRIAELEAS